MKGALARVLLFPYGWRNRKNLFVALSGIAFEEFPLPSNVPLVFVIHCVKGDAMLVELNSV